MIDFAKLTGDEVIELNKDRAEKLKEATNGMFIEPSTISPIYNELRFNHGYWHLFPFLINDQTSQKFELRVVDDRKHIHLAYIQVGEDSRQQGLGNQMLKTLTDLADKYGYSIDLDVKAKYGVGKRVLKNFYKKHGFVRKGAIDHMERLPR